MLPYCHALYEFGPRVFTVKLQPIGDVIRTGTLMHTLLEQLAAAISPIILENPYPASAM